MFRERRTTITPEGLDLPASYLEPDIVLDAVCFYYDIPEALLLEKTRKREVVEARHTAMYFLSINPGLSNSFIAGIFGKDHCTAFSSIRRIEGFLEIYPETSSLVLEIGQYIKWLNQLHMEITKHEITTGQIRYLYFLLDQLGIRHLKGELVQEASEGRTESARELKNLEMHQLIKHLEEKLREAKNDARPGRESFTKMDRMRKRILSMCYSMGWTRFDLVKRRHAVDMERLEAWLLKYGYLHKALNDYTYLELPTLVHQVENLMRSILEESPKTERE